MTDEEIKAVRQIRREISQECGHDVHKVAEYYRAVEEELKQSGTFRFEKSSADPPPQSRSIPPL